MAKKPKRTESILSKIERRLPQLLRIEASGSTLVPYDDEGHDDVDPVERWVAAVNHGLLGGPSARPVACVASIEAHQTDASSDAQSWDVQIHAVDWGAFMVLLNLLRGRMFTNIVLRTVPTSGVSAPELDLSRLEIPELPPQLPFACELPDPEESPELSAAISFAAARSDAVLDQAIAALDVWGELIVLGGYAAPDQDPAHSGAAPQGAILYDETTVMQSFDTVFHADLRAFNAVFSYAAKLAEQGIAISTVTIR